MLSARLPLALDEDLIDGDVRLWGPPGDLDLSLLPGPIEIIQPLQPDADRLVARGATLVRDPAASVRTAVVSLPRERGRARDRIARAAATSARILVDGQKTDGIDSILREVRKRGIDPHVIVKAHGKLFAIEGGDFADWRADRSETSDGWLTAPGSFSADGADPGSRLLADSLPRLSGAGADLGAGWGYLSRRLLSAPDVSACHMVEADRDSLDCASHNVRDARAHFHWADATAWNAPEPLDWVVMNPPFHRGRAGDPALGRAFITTAARCLHSRGRLHMVANRHLPYEGTLRHLFAEVEEHPADGAFKLFRAAKPRRSS